jgi:dimethylamine/trimethylamine dehydrogenase
MTGEQGFVHQRLLDCGVEIRPSQMLVAQATDSLRLACAASGRESDIACGTLILVTGRLPEEQLYRALAAHPQPFSVSRVGDCLQPSSVADAVYSAHDFARGLGSPGGDAAPRRERPPVKSGR